MSQEYVSALIGRMTAKEEALSSADSDRWKAHREARELTDPDLYPEIEGFILAHHKKSDNAMRRAAYYIMGCLLANTPSDGYCRFYVGCLKTETNKRILSCILGRIELISVPAGVGIDPIILCAAEKDKHVRLDAIRALGSCNCDKSREVLSSFICMEDKKAHKYEIIYANAAMGRIGLPEDISALSRHLASRVRDIKDSAACAIERIRKRTGEE